MLSVLQQQKHLPILALLFTVALSTTFMGLNKRTHTEAEYPILYAMFCLHVTTVYVLYMLISRIAILALNCIEHRYSRSGGTGSTALSPYERVMEEHLEWGADDEEEEAALHPQDSSPARPENNPVSILFARGIHREALISSMYLGGSGCFLALPALSFWNISQSCAFLLSLIGIAFFGEHTKLVEFAPNQDKAKVLRELRHLRWLLYATTLTFILCLFYKDNRDAFDQAFQQFYNEQQLQHTLHNTNHSVLASAPSSTPRFYDGGSIIMLILALVSPLLLRLSLPHAVIRSTSLMSPSQVLEAALPVSCLHAVLVLGWYSGTPPPLGINVETKWLGVFIPMLILCPFCQVVILAFILRGFRHRQTMPNVIILAFTTFIMQEIFGQSQMKASMDWYLLIMACIILIFSGALLLAKHMATACPSPSEPENVILLNDVVPSHSPECGDHAANNKECDDACSPVFFAILLHREPRGYICHCAFFAL